MIRCDLIETRYSRPRRLRFSVDDYKMIEMGIIEDYERSEIIDGEMVPKKTLGHRHAAVVNLLNRILATALPESVLLRVRNPIRISDFDEPEPDFVLADLSKYDGKRHPTPSETILVIEVSDTSLKQERDKKLRMHAEAGIAEVWIVNLLHNVVEVHRNPALDLYQEVKIFRQGETVESFVLPKLSFHVDSIIS